MELIKQLGRSQLPIKGISDWTILHVETAFILIKRYVLYFNFYLGLIMLKIETVLTFNCPLSANNYN